MTEKVKKNIADNYKELNKELSSYILQKTKLLGKEHSMKNLTQLKKQIYGW